MKISFVVPAYNEEAYLNKCLDSILAGIADSQIDAEIIVVNNNSADRTREIAVGYAGVKVVDEPQKGLTKARQTGYLATTGDLVANVDADNVLPAGWTQKVLAEFTKNENLVALSGPFIYYDLSWLINLEVKIFYLLGYLAYLFDRYLLGNGGMLQGGNFVIRRSALENINGFNTQISFYGEDTEVARRLQKVGRIKFTFSLPMFSSGRRLSREGVLVSGAKYAVNYLWILIFKKPFSKTSTDIRYN